MDISDQTHCVCQEVGWFKSEHSRQLLTSPTPHLLTSSPLIVEVWRSGVKVQPNYSASRWPSGSLRASWLHLPLTLHPPCCSNWVSHSPSALHPPPPHPSPLPHHHPHLPHPLRAPFIVLLFLIITPPSSSSPSHHHHHPHPFHLPHHPLHLPPRPFLPPPPLHLLLLLTPPPHPNLPPYPLLPPPAHLLLYLPPHPSIIIFLVSGLDEEMKKTFVSRIFTRPHPPGMAGRSPTSSCFWPSLPACRASAVVQLEEVTELPKSERGPALQGPSPKTRRVPQIPQEGGRGGSQEQRAFPGLHQLISQ